MSLKRPVVIAIVAMVATVQNAWAATDTSTSAPAATPVSSPTTNNASNSSVSDELSASELADTFRSFEVAVVPNRTVSLRGMIYDQCYNNFQISYRQDQQGNIGFVVTDVGGSGRACVKALKAAANPPATCGRTVSCSPLSSIPGSTMDFSNAGDIRIGLMHRNLDQDPNSPDQHFEDLPNHPISHVSLTTQIQQQRQAAEAAKQKELDSLYAEFRDCRDNLDHLDIAEQALNLYAAIKHLPSTERDQKERELENARLKLLAARISRVNAAKLDSGEIDDLRSAIQDFGDQYPDMAESVAKLDYDLAQKILLQKNAPPAAYDVASQIIGDAQGLDGLSEESVSRLQGYQSTIAVGKLTSQAVSGNMDSFTFYPSYMSLMNQMMSDLQSSCSSMTMTSISESCVAARNNFLAARNIPQEMNQVQMQRAQLQMQIQRSLMAPGSTQPASFQYNPQFNPQYNPMMNMGGGVTVNSLMNPAFVNPLMGSQPQPQMF